MRNVLLFIATLATTPLHGAPLDRVAWLAGCWRGEAAGRMFEEQWMAPRGGLMLGAGRTTTGDRVTSFEQMRIEDARGRLVFTSKPSGKSEDSFTALGGDDDRVVFENLMHPFPQRVIYQREPDGSLAARIEGNRGDRIVAIDFPMHRVACEADAASPVR